MNKNEKIVELRCAGLTFREIGERVGMTPGAVYKVWHDLLMAAIEAAR